MKEQYRHFLDKYGVKIASDHVVELLDEGEKDPHEKLANEAWYGALFNLDYMRDFCYVSSHVEDRESYIPRPKN